MKFSSILGSAGADFTSILLLCILPFTQGQSNNLTPVPSPNLDLSSLGRLALGGDFDAISLYSYYGQTEGISGNGSQSIFSTLPNGAISILSSADASINTMCTFVLKDGTVAGVVVGGNFTSLGGVDAQAIALFDPSTDTVTPLPGVQGSVSAILCDQDTNSVYVGGSFKAANSTNAIAWVGMTGWANLPFAGFNAPVTSITKAPNGHIVFGGSFSGLGNASIPTVGGMQVINVASANISAGSSTTTAGYSNPQNIACPSNGTSGPGNTWLLQDKTPGYWRAETQFGFQPTKLRIWNTNQDGRGAKTFRFVAQPINGIMNFTYTDPSTGDQAACDATCPLAPNTTFQDFTFVNLVGMNGFQIDISDWYGNGGGLNGVELFENDIFAYAVSDFNEPTCANVDFPSNVTATGPWTVTPSGQSVSEYLSASIGTSDLTTTSVVFEPDIKQAGNYTVTIYTPGCLNDASCASRGIINVTATLSTTGAESFSTQLYQTNNFEKYDQVFLGPIAAASDSFRPSVTITPAGGPSNLEVVASRVKFGFTPGSFGLNGLFDFNPNQAIVDTDFSKSAINNAGTELKPDAIVNALITIDNVIYSAGAFSDDVFENIMAFQNNSATSLPGGGLNAPVSSMYTLGDFLYIGGNFTNTSSGGVAGLNNVAAYQLSKDAWMALGAGLDGSVASIVPLQMNITENQPETVIGMSGAFTHTLASGTAQESTASGFAVWVPSHNDWLQNLNVSRLLLSGRLTAYADVPNGTFLLAGIMASEGNAISGAVSLDQAPSGDSLQRYPFKIQSSVSSVHSSLSKRASGSTPTTTGVATVAFYDSNGVNVTVFGGSFTGTATNGSMIENLLFLNGSNNDAVTGLPTALDSNSTFLALATQNNLLFAGGSMTGQVTGSPIDGLVVYNLQTAQYIDTQPPALQGDSVIVNAISVRPTTSEVYVGGSFDSAGSLPCSTVCMFNPTTGQWNAAGSDLAGSISSLYWSSNTKLMAAGDLTIAGSNTSLATYDAIHHNWTASSTTQFPGPVTAFAPVVLDGSQAWVSGKAANGSTFLIKINGDKHSAVGDVFGSSTVIREMQVLSLTQAHASTPLLDDSQVLLLSGQLDLPDFGNASAALYNGTNFTPWILSSTMNGQSGSMAGLFSSNTNPLKPGGHHHSRGIVVLVALCAALGTLFLIVFLGIILDRVQRRRAGYNSIPSGAYSDKNSNITRVPPEHLFGSLGQRNSTSPPRV